MNVWQFIGLTFAFRALTFRWNFLFFLGSPYWEFLLICYEGIGI